MLSEITRGQNQHMTAAIYGSILIWHIFKKSPIIPKILHY
jgi:hypothetical protein